MPRLNADQLSACHVVVGAEQDLDGICAPLPEKAIQVGEYNRLRLSAQTPKGGANLQSLQVRGEVADSPPCAEWGVAVESLKSRGSSRIRLIPPVL